MAKSKVPPLDLGPRGRYSSDAEWGAIRALEAWGAPIDMIAQQVRRTRCAIYSALREALPPSARPKGVRKPTALQVKRRRMTKQLLTKRVIRKGVKRVFARGRPPKDPNWKRPFTEVTCNYVHFPYGSTRRCRRQLKALGLSSSPNTVRRDRHAVGLKLISRGKRQFLTEEQMDRRVRVFRPLSRRSASWYEGVIFSDEKIFDSNGHGHLQQYVNDKSEREPLTQAQYPTCIHVWGAIGVGWRRLIIFDENCSITTEVYQQKCLAPVLNKLREATAFMHDGAGVHVAAEPYLKKNKVTLMPWTAASPDANPIENMWHTVARAVSEKGPWGREQLEKFIKEAWAEIPTEVIDNLVLSFKRRCEKIVEAEGRAIKLEYRRRARADE